MHTSPQSPVRIPSTYAEVTCKEFPFTTMASCSVSFEGTVWPHRGGKAQTGSTRKWVLQEQPLTNEGRNWWVTSNSSSVRVTFRGSFHPISKGKTDLSSLPCLIPSLPHQCLLESLPKKLLALKSLFQHVLCGEPKHSPSPNRWFLPNISSFPSLSPPSYFHFPKCIKFIHNSLKNSWSLLHWEEKTKNNEPPLSLSTKISLLAMHSHKHTHTSLEVTKNRR